MSMQPPLEFVHAALSARAIFGKGQIGRLGGELELLKISRALLICTPRGEQRYASIVDELGARSAGIFAKAEPHCPEPVAAAAVEAMAAARADGVVTVGGGSTIGLGKYIAAKTGRPFVAVPTTFSGSEMTPLYGLKIGLEKRTWVDPAAKPRTVIYDPELVASLPTHEAATTGMNGLAHCIEALYPAVPNPLARLMALEGIAAFAAGLRGITSRNDEVSHSCALYGGFIGGLLVSMVGIGLHHRICHVLGGRFGVPHGESNSVILPHVTAFNAPALGEDASAIARAMDRNDAGVAMFEIAESLGVPRSLRELGLPKDQLDGVASEVLAKPLHNPRPLTIEAVRRLLENAWQGRNDAVVPQVVLSARSSQMGSHE
jgi:alcohol dehydrogenase class IV